ncbi:hypothetical protein M408DRAFT_306492, partial [Serendipita vermifera MAFF 305830]
ASVILFIFAVTSGSTKGWATGYVLAPLLISILLFVLFLVWEAYTPPDGAVLPPRMWYFRNFGVLVGLALLPYFWSISSFVEFTSWWQDIFGWTAISVAVRFLPVGVGGFIISQITGRLPTYFAHKHILMFGLIIAIIATILLPFGDAPIYTGPSSSPRSASARLAWSSSTPILQSPSFRTRRLQLPVPSVPCSTVLSS